MQNSEHYANSSYLNDIIFVEGIKKNVCKLRVLIAAQSTIKTFRYLSDKIAVVSCYSIYSLNCTLFLVMRIYF